ncbi:MAG: hypothetical protein KA780_00050 [Prolixibacteraceae bacterium]|nr:hypothetical protein [Prolixibacteraceae bacterium]
MNGEAFEPLLNHWNAEAQPQALVFFRKFLPSHKPRFPEGSRCASVCSTFNETDDGTGKLLILDGYEKKWFVNIDVIYFKFDCGTGKYCLPEAFASD